MPVKPRRSISRARSSVARRRPGTAANATAGRGEGATAGNPSAVSQARSRGAAGPRRERALTSAGGSQLVAGAESTVDRDLVAVHVARLVRREIQDQVRDLDRLSELHAAADRGGRFGVLIEIDARA